jgi:hypothetical protein
MTIIKNLLKLNTYYNFKPINIDRFTYNKNAFYLKSITYHIKLLKQNIHNICLLKMFFLIESNLNYKGDYQKIVI